MSEFARALGMESSFEWQGKTYKMAPMTYEAIALWEDYLKGNAWRELERAQKYLSPQEFDRQARGFREDIASGAYSFFSRASLSAKLSWEGMIELASVRVIVAHPELDPSAVRKMCRTIQENDLERWSEIRRKMEEADTDPNRPAPEMSPGQDGTSIPSAPPCSTSSPDLIPGKSVS